LAMVKLFLECLPWLLIIVVDCGFIGWCLRQLWLLRNSGDE
jgi:hypothetical protein